MSYQQKTLFYQRFTFIIRESVAWVPNNLKY
jgi:hypothetical protein